MAATVELYGHPPFSWYGDGPYFWRCLACNRKGNFAAQPQARSEARDHNSAKHNCTCDWACVYEGEAGGVSWHIIESDKRCVTHGKPRHVAKSG